LALRIRIVLACGEPAATNLGVARALGVSRPTVATWLGLTPRERSTGGRQRRGGISRAGNERLRQLLVVGAMAVIRHAKPTSKAASHWLLGLL
ncbi:transposase, partial [Salmonella sp. SAL4432]|uniref:transposase n=1 Tax=Salmonella sp. SAL4432 TaxID=3159887 RepID=UPI00397C79A4